MLGASTTWRARARSLPLVGGLLLASGCPSFEVGPEIYEQLVDDASACSTTGELPPCRRFDVDNPGVVASELGTLITLRFGFEVPSRNLERVELSYERPGQSPVDLACAFGADMEAPANPGPVWCRSVTLDGSDLTPDTALEGTLEVQLDVLADVAGPHALSMWVTDENDLSSPVLRWQFQVLDPVDDGG